MPELPPSQDSDSKRSRAVGAAAGENKTRTCGGRLILFLATGCWFGLSPIMPGTVGALWGLPLAWGIAHVPALGPIDVVWIQAGVIVALGLLGIPLCGAAAVKLGKKDPGAVVWDEIATMPIAFFLVPAGRLSEPLVLAAGFLLHRFFDILKPPPCRQLERLKGGLGIMADDWAAAIYACLVLHGFLWVLRWGHVA